MTDVFSSSTPSLDMLVLDEHAREVSRTAMVCREASWSAPTPPPGSLYAFRTPAHTELRDPRALQLVVDPRDPNRRVSRVPHPLPFDWEDDRPPRTDWSATVLYEAHVRGLTLHHPDVPEEVRGTYAALAHPAVLEHLERIGVTAIELLPVMSFVDEPHLTPLGLHQNWGYNTAGFFALHLPYAHASDPDAADLEFKSAVKALHGAGIEVILDVVFNHTSEGGLDQPAQSLRGLDDTSYYRRHPHDPSRYDDTTGCGNSLDLSKPEALRLVLDALRHWVSEYHVDGFRFDLAVALARTPRGFDPTSPFLSAVQADPVLRGVKLIAEPWDVGLGGYQVGGFPLPWSEWNGRFRDCVRDFWRGASDGVGELGSRLTGSSDIFTPPRTPRASVNFVTAHDGFTLRDLVSFNEKHNEANGEGNRDGESHNRSWNCGVEGPSDDPRVQDLRARQARNLMLTTVLSDGVPMLLSGDELGHTQGGNNNTYCQGDLASLKWKDLDADLLSFTERLVALKPRVSTSEFRTGTTDLSDPGEAAWLNPNGDLMSTQDWLDPNRRTLALLRGDVLMVLNASSAPVTYELPSVLGAWVPALVTTTTDGVPEDTSASTTVTVAAHSSSVLTRA